MAEYKGCKIKIVTVYIKGKMVDKYEIQFGKQWCGLYGSIEEATSAIDKRKG